jgi:methylated-DNA-[protein]-cysteine S-methyltransferase
MRLQFSLFSTSLGWFCLLGRDDRVSLLTIGHRRAEDALHRLKLLINDRLDEADWQPELRQRLERFASGEVASFDDVEVEIDHRTPFQKRVLIATRGIGFGETISYGELAARVGSPNAARAVGAVMASNHIPIIIPCHRVVGSRGELVGFSTPRGIDLKRRLLKMEQIAAAVP